MEDFTGGLSEMFDLKEAPPKNLFRIMSKGMERSSLMGCSLEGTPGGIEQRLANGLVRGHAYSLTAVKQVGTVLKTGCFLFFFLFPKRFIVMNE